MRGIGARGTGLPCSRCPRPRRRPDRVRRRAPAADTRTGDPEPGSDGGARAGDQPRRHGDREPALLRPGQHRDCSQAGGRDGRSFIDGLVAAGYSKEPMEVTPDRTSINAQADNYQFSVRLNGTCLVGQYGGGGLRELRRAGARRRQVPRRHHATHRLVARRRRRRPGPSGKRRLVPMAEYIYSMVRARKAVGDKLILDDVTMSFLPGREDRRGRPERRRQVDDPQDHGRARHPQQRRGEAHARLHASAS